MTKNIASGSHCSLCCKDVRRCKTPPFKCAYGCDLWFCSEECANNMVHQLECSFVAKVAQATIDCGTDLSLSLLVLRIIFKKNIMTELYNDTVGQLSVQKHEFEKRAPRWLEQYTHFADRLLQLLKEDAHIDPTLLEFFARDEIVNIACSTLVNSFACTKNSTIISNGYFHQAALLNHSCQPNTFYSVNSRYWLAWTGLMTIIFDFGLIYTGWTMDPGPRTLDWTWPGLYLN
ncbi:hypothetical protein SAMD00019534_100890 [Acytostelium subglobosum LB1]|uniref:hypothetical protein n=1 Tax=Acytostelium subglobosum LB1 TaxID=1410327 RepID=UPI00064506AF|nr:hypothetical protein SAMD00019534_100890 [Acytostelium subglobosum LB1]GAM26914.1 hypothetical protein SAMD00019534_100890 [Acytostelium subglobosum LB1]|eukprot:XP_012750182.1 hypothetical protein SAMD00019534_100890 [Acytostelium subglobosum LB1]